MLLLRRDAGREDADTDVAVPGRDPGHQERRRGLPHDARRGRDGRPLHGAPKRQEADRQDR